jgi:hypothetical protein
MEKAVESLYIQLPYSSSFIPEWEIFPARLPVHEITTKTSRVTEITGVVTS